MGKIRTYVFIFTFSFLVMACSSHNDVQLPLSNIAGDYTKFKKYARSYILQEMKKYNVAGISIAVIDGKKIIWSQGFGYADKEKGLKATKNTVYRIGSVTKILNIIGILKAHEQKKLDINLPIVRYLPHFAMKSPKHLTDKITLKALLAHHSGIGAPDMITTNFENNPQALECKYGIRMFKNLYLAYTPNTATLYSNQGAYLSSCILQRRVHESYASYLKKSILEPLEMTKSYYATNINASNSASAYRNGNRIQSASFYTIGSVGLNSNVVDLSKLIIMILGDGKFKNRQILKASSINEMLKVQNKHIKIDFNNPMALGLFIDDSYGERVFYHTGRSSGYLAAIAFSKKSKMGIVVLINDDAKEVFLDKVTKNVLKYAIETKRHQKIHKHLSFIKSSYMQSNFAGTYALEPVSMHYTPSIIRITKENEDYKVESNFGSLYLKKDKECFRLNSSSVVNHIEEFGGVPKNSCLYTIENQDTKLIFYHDTKSGNFIVIASAFKSNIHNKEWDDYLGTFLPISVQYNRERSLRIEYLKLIKKDHYYVLHIYLEDGFVIKTPLEILDQAHARVPLVALTSIRMIEMERSGSSVYLKIGLHKFKKK